MNIDILTLKLKHMYESGIRDDSRVAMIHLFGIMHADAISRLSTNEKKDVARDATGRESYHTEIQKGANLAKYVEVKAKYQESGKSFDIEAKKSKMSDTQYDEKFKSVDGLAWDPWVGHRYNESGIFVLGMSTYDSGDEDWKKQCDTERTANRVLVQGCGIEDPRRTGCFANTAMVFLDGAEKPYGENARKMFWESVAFANFVQEIVPAGTQVWDVGSDLLTRSRMALYAVADIIKPKLILVWGVTTVGEIYVTNRRYGENKINKAYPRIIDGVFDLPNNPPPIIGMAHPSAHFSRDKWRDFLLKEPASKETIGRFIEYLKHQPD